MRRLQTVLLVALSAFSHAYGGDTSTKFLSDHSTRVISLDDAIDMALTNNLDVKIERVNMRIDDARLRNAWGAFDPVASASFGHDNINRPQNAQEVTATGNGQNDLQTQLLLNQQVFILNQETLIQQLNALAAGTKIPPGVPAQQSQSPQLRGNVSPRIFEEDNLTAQARIEGRTPIGTRYTVFANSQRLDNSLNRTSSAALFFPEYFSTAGITVVQPLLRNFGPAANLAEVRIDRLEREISKMNWELRMLNVVALVMNNYYDMVFAIQNIKVKEDAITFSKTLETENKRRLDLGVMSPIDVNQAEVAVSVGEEDLVNAKNFLMERQLSLKRQIVGEFNMADDRMIVPKDTGLSADVPLLNRQELIIEGFQQRRDYRVALAEAAKDDLRVRFARNQIWPRVDVQGTYALNGLGGSWKDSFNNAFDSQGPQWNLGVTVSMPLTNTQARASLDIAKQQKEQTVLTIMRTELTVAIDIDTVLSRIESNRQRVETAGKSRQLAEQTLKIGQKRLGEGVTTSFDVLKFQKDLSDARTRELAATADLNKSLVQLWIANGTLLQKRRIIFMK